MTPQPAASVLITLNQVIRIGLAEAKGDVLNWSRRNFLIYLGPAFPALKARCALDPWCSLRTGSTQTGAAHVQYPKPYFRNSVPVPRCRHLGRRLRSPLRDGQQVLVSSFLALRRPETFVKKPRSASTFLRIEGFSESCNKLRGP